MDKITIRSEKERWGMKNVSRSRLIIIIVAVFLTVITLLITIFSVKNGIADVYPYLYIVPVILLRTAYRRGQGVFSPSSLDGCILGAVYLYGALDVHLLASGSLWFYVFVSLGVLISAYTNEITNNGNFMIFSRTPQARDLHIYPKVPEGPAA